MTDVRAAVCAANRDLGRSGLVLLTFGNVSGLDRKTGTMYIKPSGVPYDELTPDNMVPVSLATGKVIDSKFTPSSDTPTHLELYRAFPCNGVVHTHSEFATTFAQARLPIRCTGTTHADYFYGDVPVTRSLTADEVEEAYEENTGKVIVETFRHHDPTRIQAVLVAQHGPFIWGPDPQDAVENAQVLELLARMAFKLRLFHVGDHVMEEFLVKKHYERKHGKGAYYGQKKQS
jgi:L-ribulose-5-phosphate 4-epimerase